MPGSVGTAGNRLLAAVDSVVSTIGEPQLRFLTDTSRWRIAVCGRQCGKNWAVARMCLLMALERPRANIIYVNATFREARGIMWADELDGLPAVARSLDIACTTNESRLELTLSNGSRITLMGADRGAWAKLRGLKIDLLVVDEMQKMDDAGLKSALEQVIPATLVARDGSFVGIGTPDEFCVGLLHDICTTDRFPQFSVHHWTAESIDSRPDIWQGLLRWKAESGMADDDPRWLREGKGLWARQDSALMLPVGPMGLWDGRLPELVPNSAGTLVRRSVPVESYGGIDFGFAHDPAAIVAASISREEGVLREVHSSKHHGLNTQQLADAVRRVMREHDVRRFYADSADPKTIEDLRTLYGLPIVPCEKHEKEPWISEMRAHLIDGRLRIMEGSALHDELKTLAPDPDQLVRRKLTAMPGSDDHCYDAFRYLYRGVHTNHVRAPEAPLDLEARKMRDIQRAIASQRRPDDGRHRTAGNRR